MYFFLRAYYLKDINKNSFPHYMKWDLKRSSFLGGAGAAGRKRTGGRQPRKRPGVGACSWLEPGISKFINEKKFIVKIYDMELAILLIPEGAQWWYPHFLCCIAALTFTSRTFSFPQADFAPLNADSPAPGNCYSTFCLYRFDYSRNLK